MPLVKFIDESCEILKEMLALPFCFVALQLCGKLLLEMMHCGAGVHGSLRAEKEFGFFFGL